MQGTLAGKKGPTTSIPVMEDPHQTTRQTVKSKTEVDRIFQEHCLFVAPLYAVAEESVGGGQGRGEEVGGGGSGNRLYEALPDDSIVIHTLEHVDGVLEEMWPSFVVVLSPDIAVTRMLEVFKAQNAGVTLRVYYLSYADSVEEQRYLSEVRRETEAFKSLIENKASMVVPDAQDGKSGDVVVMAPDAPRPTSTRKGGLGAVRRTKVIVDVREFRSALPSLLHQRGMELIPLTLEVADRLHFVAEYHTTLYVSS